MREILINEAQNKFIMKFPLQQNRNKYNQQNLN